MNKDIPELQNKRQIKPYLVMQYLIKNSDENNLITSHDIVAYLEDDCGIAAERRSIYRDIDEINKAIIILEQNCTIEEAEQILEEDEYDEEKFIIYDKSRKGFYAKNHNFDVNDIRLLAECVYSAKFLEKAQTEFLVDIICQNVSEMQAETIKHDVLLTDRVRTNNAEVLNNIITINAPKEQGDSWVVNRDKPGIGYGKNARPATHEILVGKNKWVSRKEWQAAIRARKNGTATKQQKEMLDNGHWKDKR